MKKKFALVWVLVLLAVVLAGCTSSRTGTWSISGSHTGLQRSVNDEGLSISGRTMNGRFTTNVELNAGNLAAFHVESSNSSGKASILLTQGNVERSFDISGAFSDNLDMGAFGAGRISVRFVFESAENVDIVISWG